MIPRLSIGLAVLLCTLTNPQVQGQQPSGRYYTPATLTAALNGGDTEKAKAALSYLVGTYDLAQDVGKSCAIRGTTTPEMLEKVFSDYLRAHPELLQADRTAAGVAAQAFAEHWPCRGRAIANGGLAVWPKEMGQYSATSSDTIPPFPQMLSGYRSEEGKDFWGKAYPASGTIRIFKGENWKGLQRFPNTMNGCSSGVFMIRWRASDPEVQIDSTVRNSATLDGTMVTGAYGYMFATNCDQPLFKFASAVSKNSSTLVDIFYELKFWQAAP